MKNLKDKVAVITGAGSGMGRELAIQLAALGAKVALNDWNHANLQDTLETVKKQGGIGIARSFDVSVKESVYAFSEEVLSTFGHVDIVINNAGIALPPTNIEFTGYEDFEKLVGINLWGVIYGTKAYLSHLQTRPEAAVVNVSSVFGIMGYPTQGAYCVSKFGVKGFNEVLRLELQSENSKVVVTSVHPGGIKTNIVRNIEYASNTTKEEKKTMADDFDTKAPTTAAEAARQIIQAIKNKNPRLVIGSDGRFIDRLVRLLPVKYANIIMKKYQDVKRTSENLAKNQADMVAK